MTTTTITPATQDITLTPNVTLRYIASNSQAHVFLLEVQREPVCFVRRLGGRVQCRTLDMDQTMGGGPSYSVAVGAALTSTQTHLRNQAKHWADTMVTRTDPVQRSEARGQLELAVAQHDMLQREIDAIYAALAEDQAEQDAQEQRAPAEDDTPF